MPQYYAERKHKVTAIPNARARATTVSKKKRKKTRTSFGDLSDDSEEEERKNAEVKEILHAAAQQFKANLAADLVTNLNAIIGLP